jgi:hypothetical protein
MGKYSEVFVGIDTAKKKHAVAVADGGRDGEVLYFGEIDSAPVTVERVLKKMAGKYEKLGSATKPGRRATSSPAALSCARTRSLTASWTESGTQTDVNSPARQPGQRHGIASIRLDSIASFLGYQRRRHHPALVT